MHFHYISSLLDWFTVDSPRQLPTSSLLHTPYSARRLLRSVNIIDRVFANDALPLVRGCPSPFSSSSCSSDWHSSSSGSFPSPLPWRDWMECLAGVSRYCTPAVCCSCDVSLSPRVLRLWPARDCWPTPCQTWGCRQYTRVPAGCWKFKSPLFYRCFLPRE